MVRKPPGADEQPKPEELTMITKAYDLMREMTRRVAKLPRDYKFVLGDRILSNVDEFFDMLIEAKFTRDKLPLLDRANLRSTAGRSALGESRPVPGRKAEYRSSVGRLVAPGRTSPHAFLFPPPLSQGEAGRGWAVYLKTTTHAKTQRGQDGFVQCTLRLCAFAPLRLCVRPMKLALPHAPQ